ncbi:hypothetical protein D3C74_333590 [compost metagenome]
MAHHGKKIRFSLSGLLCRFFGPENLPFIRNIAEGTHHPAYPAFMHKRGNPVAGKKAGAVFPPEDFVPFAACTAVLEGLRDRTFNLVP